jgi:hypothetical protein
VINNIVVAAIGAARHPNSLFFVWLGIEIVIGALRLVVGNRAQKLGSTPPVRLRARCATGAPWLATG